MGLKKYLRKKMAGIFPNLVKGIAAQIQKGP